jgi:hypothetical protein
MRGEIERFSSGWVGLQLRFRANERDELIEALRSLPANQHFHLRAIFSDKSDKPGIADIEISFQGEDEPDNLRLDA